MVNKTCGLFCMSRCCLHDVWVVLYECVLSTRRGYMSRCCLQDVWVVLYEWVFSTRRVGSFV